MVTSDAIFFNEKVLRLQTKIIILTKNDYVILNCVPSSTTVSSRLKCYRIYCRGLQLKIAMSVNIIRLFFKRQDPIELYIILSWRMQVKMLGESFAFSLQSTLLSNSTSYCILMSSFHLFNLFKRFSLSGFLYLKADSYTILLEAFAFGGILIR